MTSALLHGVVSVSWPLPFLINTSQMIMNNKYDRDLPKDFLDAEQAKSRQAALNVLSILQQKEHMRKTRAAAVRAQYIEPNELTG